MGKIARRFRRKPKGQAGPLEWIISLGKGICASALIFARNAANLIHDNFDAMKSVSPFWITIIIGGVALTIIGMTELKNEKAKGPETEVK